MGPCTEAVACRPSGSRLRTQAPLLLLPAAGLLVSLGGSNTHSSGGQTHVTLKNGKKATDPGKANSNHVPVLSKRTLPGVSKHSLAFSLWVVCTKSLKMYV